jgi:putative transcriptional regulator
MTDEKYLKKLGENVFALRTKKGLTQVQLATAIGTKHPQVYRVEKGDINSTINMLRKIAKALDVSLVELIDIK